MFATEEGVSSVATDSSRAPFVFKTEASPDGSASPGQFHHQLHNVIITPVSSPPATPATVASPAASPVSFDPSGTSATHPDLSNFSQQFAGYNFQTSLPPPPPVPSICRMLTPRTDPTGCEENGITLLGKKYILLDQLEGSNLRRCIHVETDEQFVCKIVNNDPVGRGMLAAHFRVDGHPNINPIHEVIVGDKQTYLFFPPCFTDLHSYVRTRRRLREPQARPLFRQIVSAVHEAHSKGIVLRDLKLRKFVFADESRTELKLESLEDAIVLDDNSHDLLSDKHGCPAYVSPEILTSHSQYSGRAADMWGLGVMLYTMLVGRYPFHGQEHTGLFAKIRRGHFSLPDTLSSRAKCLIRCLLRKEPEERLNTEDVLIHPWMTQLSNRERYRRSVTSATVAASLSTTTGSTAATNPSSSGWSGASQAASASTVLTPSANVASGGIGTSNLSVGGYSYENHDQVVPDCVVPDLMDVDKN